MPKEVIDNRWYGKPVKQVDGPDLPADNRYAAVGWTKDGDAVQIGLVVPPPPGCAQSGEDEQLWMDLDRDGINRLIRVLRKARDEAMGRDE